MPERPGCLLAIVLVILNWLTRAWAALQFAWSFGPPEWQPFASAPKDGTPILARRRMHDGSDQTTRLVWTGEAWHSASGVHCTSEFTHWRKI